MACRWLRRWPIVQVGFDSLILAMVVWLVIVEGRTAREALLLANTNALYIRAIEAETLPILTAMQDPDVRAELLILAERMTKAKEAGLLTPGEWRKVGDDAHAIIVPGEPHD